MVPHTRSVKATGMPEGKHIRGNTIDVPSQSALPREVYQSSRREAFCDRRFRAFHMPNIIAKRQAARNPRGVVRRTRVLFGSCTVCRLVHVLVPLRTSSRHMTIQANARRMTPENSTPVDLLGTGFVGDRPLESAGDRPWRHNGDSRAATP